MQAPAGIADAFGQPRLDIHVDVFERFIEDEVAPLDLGADGGKAIGDGALIIGGDDTDLGEHRGMSQRALDILPPYPFVEADGGVDVAHDPRRAGGETAAPLRIRAGGACLIGVRCRKRLTAIVQGAYPK